jgi:uncharacterized Zn-finger protein
MSLMKTHVQYSQNLAVEFSHLMKDYEELVEAPEVILPAVQEVQEEVDLEAVCAVFEELMDNEPIAVLRALRSNGVHEDVMAAVIEQEELEESNEDLITNNLLEESHSLCSEERRFLRLKKPQLLVSSTKVKSFQFSVDNNRHMLVNSKKKTFECTICGKGFSLKANRDVHTRVHTGEKPFECAICGKNFSQQGVMKRHNKIHTREKPFECSICGKWFRQKSSLTVHTRTHKKRCHF